MVPFDVTMDRLDAGKLQGGETNRKPIPDNAPDIDVRGQQIRDPNVPPKDLHLFTRRNFLSAGAVLTAAGAVEAVDSVKGFSPIGKLLNDKIVGQYDYDADVRETKHFLKEQYGIDFALGPEKDQKEILGRVPSIEKYKTTLRVMKEEMQLNYPPDMIRKIGEGRGFETRAIENLSTTMRIAGMYDTDQMEMSSLAPPLVPGRPAQLLINPRISEGFQRQTLHHDLNHRLSVQLGNPQERDRKWIALHKKVSQNPYRRVAGDTGIKGVRADTPPTERYFLTKYASASPEEDQAVCAEWMLTPRLHAEFVRRRDNDPDEKVREILAAKYEQVIADYSEWSDGEMGRPFWDGIYRKGLEEKPIPQEKD